MFRELQVVALAGVKQNICPKGVGGILMFQPKRASKQKRRACAIPLMGAAGLSLSVATGASAATVGPAAHEILSMKRKFLTSAWRHSMSSTRKASVHAGPTYSLSDAAATAAATTPAAATEAAGAATEAAEVATGAAEVAAALAGVAASELGSPAAAAAAAAIGVGGTAYGSGAIIEIGPIAA